MIMHRELTRVVDDFHVEQYRSKGYLLIPELVPFDEVTALRAEVDRLFDDDHLTNRDNLRAQGRETLGGGFVVDRLDPVIDISDNIRELAKSPVILSCLAQLLGEEVLLFKDKLISKPPGAHGYRTHQDYTYWLELSAPASAVVTMAIALDSASHDNGATEFFSGCHHRHLLETKTPEDVFDPNKGLSESVEELKTLKPELIPLRPGDGVAFHSLTPHCSGPNASSRPRRQLFFSYAAASYGDLYDTYYSLFQGYLRKDREKSGFTASFFV